MYLQTYIHAYIHAYIHTYIHTCIHTYKHTYIHTYIHGYICMYVCMYVVMGPINCTERVLQKISITEPSLRFTGESFKAYRKVNLMGWYHLSSFHHFYLPTNASVYNCEPLVHWLLMMTLVHIYIIFIQLMMRLHCVTPLRVLDLPIVSLKVVTWAQSVNVSTYAMGHRIMLEEDRVWIGG